MPRVKKMDAVKDVTDDKESIVKKRVTKKTTTNENSKATTKKSSTKTTTKSKSETKSTTKKATASKKKVAKTTATKTTKKSKTVSKETTEKTKTTVQRTRKTKVDIAEYYDLPYRYNQTIVKALYQTPETLFIYWDIADEDRLTFTKKYGSDFFNNTIPVLLVHNKTMNYTFEVEVNDFADNWYLNINDTNCEYSVELGRKPKYDNNHINIDNNYLFVASSNQIETPNDHILFDKNIKSVDFKNVKNNTISKHDISYISAIQNICKLYGLDYSNINLDDYDLLFNHINLNNPSSGNPTSTFK